MARLRGVGAAVHGARVVDELEDVEGKRSIRIHFLIHLFEGFDGRQDQMVLLIPGRVLAEQNLGS